MVIMVKHQGTFMLLTVILIIIIIIISFPSLTHSFITDLKPSFSANPSHCSLSFSSSGQTTWIPESYFFAYPFLLFSFSVLHFLVVVSVR